MQEFTCVGAGASKASYWEHSYSFLYSWDNWGIPIALKYQLFPPTVTLSNVHTREYLIHELSRRQEITN